MKTMTQSHDRQIRIRWAKLAFDIAQPDFVRTPETVRELLQAREEMVENGVCIDLMTQGLLTMLEREMAEVVVGAPDVEDGPPVNTEWLPGIEIRRARNRIEKSLETTAIEAGISKPYLSVIETGKTSAVPAPAVLRRLAKVLEQSDTERWARMAMLAKTPKPVLNLLSQETIEAFVGRLPAWQGAAKNAEAR